MINSPRTPFGSLAEVYERVAVPAMFIPEALGLLEIVALQPGERVLDVACGTGIVARLAAPRLGITGHIVGLDLNEVMLAVARAQPIPTGAPIEWRQGNAMSLPFPDATFDAVVCQNGLQFIPDRVLALQEMLRVLRPERRLVLSVIARESASQAVEATVARFLGPDAAASFREPFMLGNAEALAHLFDGIGFSSVEITRQNITARCPTADAFIAFTLSVRLASALEKLSPEQRAALLADAHTQLAPYLSNDGIVFPVEMLVVVGRS